jgi:UDP-N-acetylglucosamine acyltransferase
MAIHPTAIVEDGAQLGADVEIGPFCLVGRKAKLGDGVRLISHASVTGDTTLGARSVVHPGAFLGGEGQIRGNDAPQARLVIGEDNVIREGVTMNLGSAIGHGVTQVGARGYFMSMSHIAHDCQVGDDVTMANGAVLAGHVQVGDGAVFGGLSAVQQYGRIGRGAMLGGISGANNDVIPYGMAWGPHAKLIGLNTVGLKRRGLSHADLHAMRAAFRAIFLEPLGSLKERVTAAREKWADIAQVVEICDFILAPAKRSLLPVRMHGHDADDE